MGFESPAAHSTKPPYSYEPTPSSRALTARRRDDRPAAPAHAPHSADSDLRGASGPLRLARPLRDAGGAQVTPAQLAVPMAPPATTTTRSRVTPTRALGGKGGRKPPFFAVERRARDGIVPIAPQKNRRGRFRDTRRGVTDTGTWQAERS